MTLAASGDDSHNLAEPAPMVRSKPAAAPIRVLLADDHALVRLGFRALLAQLDGVETVADAGDGREALDLIRTCRPDVAMLDISMPGLDGLSVARLVATEGPSGTRVIILSMHQEPEYVQGAVRAGAAGYVLKNARLAEVEAALRTVMAGQSYFSPGVRGFLGPQAKFTPEPASGHRAVGQSEARVPPGGNSRRSGSLPAPGGDLPASSGTVPDLSPRQHQLVRFIAEGLSTRAIAERLGIAVKTVETHRSLLMARLGAHRVADVVHFAIRYGYIEAGSTEIRSQGDGRAENSLDRP